ncbi:hypothetical protein CJ179_48540 [Rhodococcus sp. ACS1]|uniref:DUF2946 domain-containing protein n=1 Tax=Rhodococcus pseudokoreensis TaxID=2811421 RepID=A0A974VZ47_9NOCA|nr:MULTISPECIES: DUF6153 family protein [Rhodococcus]PBC35442.1 hypothetical protein CJ179_48540 [Rhodococcus sp. ACS1]QSE87712.1 hypothetical protein JWS13_03440 [Rhodococcus pseudokoreensis]
MAVKALGATPTMQHLLRVAAVVAVLVGVLLMHSSPLLDHTGGHATESAHDSGGHGHSHEAAEPMALGDLPVALAGTGCEGTDCDDHTGLHLCMAVVTIAAALVIARWYATAAAGEAAVHGLRAPLPIRAGRAPPWTTPTLAQLSVLRV